MKYIQFHPISQAELHFPTSGSMLSQENCSGEGRDQLEADGPERTQAESGREKILLFQG